MNSLSFEQNFPKSMGPSRVAYSNANSRKFAKIEVLRDFMPVLFIYKFDKDSIKTKVGIIRKNISLLFVYGRLKGK